jgi:predicted regulator of Ras-like GTPase activity (Roadblock/LC7/MglB family)
MIDADLKTQLERILDDLSRIKGLKGSLIVESKGELLCQRIPQGTDTSLFGSMAQVITNSSKKLLNATVHGEIDSVLVESKNGKAMLLHLGKVYLILLIEISAPMGRVMISSKKAAQKITELIKNLEPVPLKLEPSEVPEKEFVEITESLETGENLKITDKSPADELESEFLEEPELKASNLESEVKIELESKVKSGIEEYSGINKVIEALKRPKTKAKEGIEPEIEKTPGTKTEKEPVPKTGKTTEIDEILAPKPQDAPKIEAAETEIEYEELSETEKLPETKILSKTEKFEPEPSLPVIKPPIHFPEIANVVEIPENDEKRAELVLNIYESIFLAMSIGASKIMGVTPARGLNQKFLPIEKFKSLLEGVEVENNATINFDKIRKNARKIPPAERETRFIEDFSQIISIVTDNYGQVMSYAAFRGMVRPEFQIINHAFGWAMDQLGIKEKIHLELKSLIE